MPERHFADRGEGSHALAIHVKAHGVVVVSADDVASVDHQPAEAFDGLRPIIDHIAAEDHGTRLRLRRKHRRQRRPVSVDVQRMRSLIGRRGRGANTSCRSVDFGPLPLVADFLKKFTIFDVSNIVSLPTWPAARLDGQ